MSSAVGDGEPHEACPGDHGAAQQGDEADEAGASDGASQLIPGVGPALSRDRGSRGSIVSESRARPARDSSRWFAVRAIYLHERAEDGGGVYEERILLFRTHAIERAFELAQEESAQYLGLNPRFSRIGNWTAFELQPSVRDLHAVEVWSSLLTSQLEPALFYEQRYTAPQAPFLDA